MDSQHQAKSSVVEFGRKIPDKTSKRAVYVNDRVSRCQGCIHICHSNYYDERKWREYTRNYSLIDYSIPFPNNIKNTLKDTPFKIRKITIEIPDDIFIPVSKMNEIRREAVSKLIEKRQNYV